MSAKDQPRQMPGQFIGGQFDKIHHGEPTIELGTTTENRAGQALRDGLDAGLSEADKTLLSESIALYGERLDQIARRHPGWDLDGQVMAARVGIFREGVPGHIVFRAEAAHFSEIVGVPLAPEHVDDQAAVFAEASGLFAARGWNLPMAATKLSASGDLDSPKGMTLYNAHELWSRRVDMRRSMEGQLQYRDPFTPHGGPDVWRDADDPAELVERTMACAATLQELPREAAYLYSQEVEEGGAPEARVNDDGSFKMSYLLHEQDPSSGERPRVRVRLAPDGAPDFYEGPPGLRDATTGSAARVRRLILDAPEMDARLYHLRPEGPVRSHRDLIMQEESIRVGIMGTLGLDSPEQVTVPALLAGDPDRSVFVKVSPRGGGRTVIRASRKRAGGLQFAMKGVRSDATERKILRAVNSCSGSFEALLLASEDAGTVGRPNYL